MNHSTKVEHTELHKGSFETLFSVGFDSTALRVTLENGDEIWFEHILNEALKYWKNFFCKNKLLNQKNTYATH